tara:strand:- start:466 stop:3690 length:3225 start_codon:yes stop_codon:yes gene_type:complete
MNDKKLNLIIGWLCFLISFIVYYLTAEPTVSFWDTGEYITTSAKLQVGHPPGAPLYQMLGAIFSIFAIEKENIGFTMNLMSGFASALTISFMYWSIVLVLKKLTSDIKDTIKKQLMVSSSAFIGSISFAFTDTFWFSAVETEVYAMATLIMAIMFYLGLRWENDMHKAKGNKWLLLICFITGLSFGVHFMGLLVIPTIVMIYYFKNQQEILKSLNLKPFIGFIIANAIGIAILMGIFKLLLPNTLKFFSATELLFVNNLGFPFNSGTMAAFIFIIYVFYFLINYTRKKGFVNANTFTLCFLFIFIGFSSWLILPIRANADVVVNENDPSNARELLAYYNLEQYPKTYLFYGPLFSDQYSGLDKKTPYKDDNPKYEKDLIKKKYVIVNDYKNAVQNYNSKHASILPRMWSTEHAENYLNYTGYLDFKIKPRYTSESELVDFIKDFKGKINSNEIDYEDFHNFLRQYGQFLDIEKPSFMSNLNYLFDYQIGYMYWRYFMWNFSGRQDDIQGKMDMHGNWISGINFIDEWSLGVSQKNLPKEVINNKARNTYFLLPLLLGLIGLYFLYNADKKYFWILILFFLFTGIAIQVYTNVRPFEPRERDYSVVGSFYVFSIIIGLGAYYVADLFEKIKIKGTGILSFILCLFFVPVNLAMNNWDDHDRSDRYTAYEMAVNYLESCDKNAILFTIGDNDTFPLWYAQEIEGIRTDVRVVNTSLLSTDWYINQMKRKAYESDPIPSSLSFDKYRHGTRDYIIKEEISQDTVDVNVFIDFITQDEKDYKYGEILKRQGYDVAGLRSQDYNANFLPTENVRIPVNIDNVINNGIVSEKYSELIEKEIFIKIKSQALYKNRLIMLDIIANNNWERPIYFTGGAFGDEDYLWMKDFLQLDGMCYKLVPIKTLVDRSNPYEMGMIDSEKMFSIVDKWNWNIENEKNIYFDVESRKNSITYRSNISRLTNQLIFENKLIEAEKIIDNCMKKFPTNKFGYYTLLEPFIISYYKIDKEEKARKLFDEIAEKYQEKLFYYSGLNDSNKNRYAEEIYTDIERYRSLVDVMINFEEGEFLETRMQEFNNYLDLFL